jgi:hypothetical protein
MDSFGRILERKSDDEMGEVLSLTDELLWFPLSNFNFWFSPQNSTILSM